MHSLALQIAIKAHVFSIYGETLDDFPEDGIVRYLLSADTNAPSDTSQGGRLYTRDILVADNSGQWLRELGLSSPWHEEVADELRRGRRTADELFRRALSVNDDSRVGDDGNEGRTLETPRQLLRVVPVALSVEGLQMLQYEMVPFYALQQTHVIHPGIGAAVPFSVVAGNIVALAGRFCIATIDEGYVLRCADTEEGRLRVPVPGRFEKTGPGGSWIWRPLFLEWKEFYDNMNRPEYATFAMLMQICRSGSSYDQFMPDYSLHVAEGIYN